MAELNKVRVQVLDPTTGAVVENVDVKTSDAAVYLPDGTTLRDWMANSEEEHVDLQKALAEHIKNSDTNIQDKIDTSIQALDAEVTNVVVADPETGIQGVDPDVAVTIKEVDGKITEVTATVKEETFEAYGAAKAVQGETEETVASVDAKVSALQTSAEITVEKLESATDGYIASYVVIQGGEQVGATIDIPKDYLVKSAELKEAEEDIKVGDATVVPSGHKYIDFVINTVEDEGNESHIYLDVNTLVDVYTGVTGTEVKVDVSGGQISAELVDGGITGAKIADATIARAKIDADFEEDIAAVEDGLADKITLDEQEADLKFITDTKTVVLGVSTTASSTVFATVGELADPITVEATTTGEGELSYKWFKKVAGTDVAFTEIEGATEATLPAAKISVAAPNTTTYYCVVSAENADPVASKKVTVIATE